MKRKPRLFPVAIAAAHAIAIVILGYRMLGPVPRFYSQVVSWVAFAAWTLIPTRPRFQVFRAAFYLGLALFVLHKLEERETGFITALAQLTRIPVPEPQSHQVYALYTLASAWLLVLLLAGRGIELGYYLAWELLRVHGPRRAGHFVFPFFREEGFGHFPGMASAGVLAPAAWLGAWRLAGLERP